MTNLLSTSPKAVRRLVGLLLWIPLALIGITVTADTLDKNAITVNVNNHIAMLQSPKVGNIGVFYGDDGVILIDDQMAPLTKDILKAIARLSKRSVHFLLNTHWHPDHTGGNENLGKRGAIILAHDKVRVRLSTAQFLKQFNANLPALPKVALPVVTFNDTVTLHRNGDEMFVFHVANAHTDGDSVVHFRQSNVIHTGDVFFNGVYPFIDVDHGGSLDGTITAAEKIASLANDETRIIPGHGPLADKAALLGYITMLKDVRSRITDLRAKGKSCAEIITMAPLADLNPQWGSGVINEAAFLPLLCRD